MKKPAPFNIIFGKCPVCGGRGDYYDYDLPSSDDYEGGLIIGSATEVDNVFSTVSSTQIKGSLLTPSSAGSLASLRLYAQLGAIDAGWRQVWAAVYTLSGLVGTKVGETYATQVQCRGVVSYPWGVQASPSWITLIMQSALTLDTGTNYLIVFKTDAPYGMSIGANISGADDYLYSGAGGSDAFDDNITFETVSSPFAFSPVCVYGSTIGSSVVASVESVTSGNGYELVDYKGEKMCSTCRKTKMMADESRIMMDRARREDDERAAMGFVKTYTQ